MCAAGVSLIQAVSTCGNENIDETQTRDEDKNLQKHIGKKHFGQLYVGSFQRYAQAAYTHSMFEDRVEQHRHVAVVAAVAVAVAVGAYPMCH